MRFTFFILLSFVFSLQLHAEIIRGQLTDCTMYQVRNSKLVEGAKVFEPALRDDEVVIATRGYYGLNLENMQIDFEQRYVYVDIIKMLQLGFDTPFLPHPVRIKADHPRFKVFLDIINKRRNVIQSICLHNNLEVYEFTTSLESEADKGLINL